MGSERSKFEFTKDGFKKGEYSIYMRVWCDGILVSEQYLFGVSKKYEAENACKALNKRFN